MRRCLGTVHENATLQSVLERKTQARLDFDDRSALQSKRAEHKRVMNENRRYLARHAAGLLDLEPMLHTNFIPPALDPDHTNIVLHHVAGRPHHWIDGAERCPSLLSGWGAAIGFGTGSCRPPLVWSRQVIKFLQPNRPHQCTLQDDRAQAQKHTWPRLA